jgi:hypothetical protein
MNAPELSREGPSGSRTAQHHHVDRSRTPARSDRTDVHVSRAEKVANDVEYRRCLEPVSDIGSHERSEVERLERLHDLEYSGERRARI